MISLKIGGIIVAAFVAGAFVASPELRAYAANTVGSGDIINNSIQSVDIKDGQIMTVDLAQASVTNGKIKDGEVRAEEIATDAVGASELQGVTKLIFADCNVPASTGGSGQGIQQTLYCPVAGVDPEDEVIVTDHQFDCFPILSAYVADTSRVALVFGNICDGLYSRSAGHVSIIVYDELADKPAIT